MKLYLDCETYSRKDIKKNGAYKYAQHCELLLLGYCNDSGVSDVWDLTTSDTMPHQLAVNLYKPTTTKIAHNAFFDSHVLYHTLGVPLVGWECTQAKAATLGLPLPLDALGRALGLPETKRKIDGSKPIKRFCKPAPKNHKARRYNRYTHPEEWELFVEYCRRDIEVTRLIDRLLPDWNYRDNEKEYKLYLIDQAINNRGLPIDLKLVERCLELNKGIKENINDKMKQITGYNATQTEKIREWLDVVDLTAETVKDILNDPSTEDVDRYVLELRQAAAKTSVAKYQAVKNCHVKGRVYGALQYCGAGQTGRWAGRLIQPQNFPRPTVPVNVACNTVSNDTINLIYPKVTEQPSVLASALRGMIYAPYGKRLIWCDLSQIENRSLLYLADDQQGLDVYRNKQDPYVTTASKIFNRESKDITKEQRFLGKTAVLMLGYEGGVDRFMRACKSQGQPIERAKAEIIVSKWRKINYKIVWFWHHVAECVNKALVRHSCEVISPTITVCATLHNDRKYLKIKLPNGRYVVYYDPKVQTVKHPKTGNLVPRITAMGFNTYTHKWERQQLYGGKFVAHITQSFARCVISERIPELERKDYKIILSIHDELIAEVPANGGHSPEAMEHIMTRELPWAPKLPLGAKAKQSKRYGT